MIWTLRPVPVHDVGPEQVRLPENPGGAGQTGENDRRVDRRGRAPAQANPTSCWPSTAAAWPRRGSRPTTSWPAPAKPPRRPKPRRRRPARRNARSWSPRPKRDIEAETRRSLEQIRSEVADLTVLATEKVTRKSAHRRGPEAARRGGPRRGRLLGALGGGEELDARGRPRIRRGPLRGRQGQRQARLAAVAAGPVRRRGRPQPRAAGLPVQPLPLLRRQARGAGAGDLGRRARADRTSSSCWSRSTGCRKSSASAASSTSSGRRRTAASTSP